ncbi:uncharacterized protein [Nothobranchius furzeri]|uniref:uncharacterized protein isoform X2 n=1 Tax=Nothobranchius furzeri TaxID=105023 RepID=UPI0024045C9B|nr:ras-related protein Rab-1B isoform X2 [Nothobranchius furzeri]
MGETLPRVPGGVPVRTLRVKMVLLGSSGVGKSSLAVRFSKDQFRDSSPTVGCAYLTRVLYLEDITLRFEIWDTAGQEKYHSVTPLYYRGAHAALVVYDICKKVETRTRKQEMVCGLFMLLLFVGNVCQSSGVAQGAGETIYSRIYGRLAHRQQGRSVSESRSFTSGRTESGPRKRFVLHRDIGFVRRSSQRAAAGCGPRGLRERRRAGRWAVRVARDAAGGSTAQKILQPVCLLLQSWTLMGLDGLSKEDESKSVQS